MLMNRSIRFDFCGSTVLLGLKWLASVISNDRGCVDGCEKGIYVFVTHADPVMKLKLKNSKKT